MFSQLATILTQKPKSKRYLSVTQNEEVRNWKFWNFEMSTEKFNQIGWRVGSWERRQPEHCRAHDSIPVRAETQNKKNKQKCHRNFELELLNYSSTKFLKRYTPTSTSTSVGLPNPFKSYGQLLTTHTTSISAIISI